MIITQLINIGGFVKDQHKNWRLKSRLMNISLCGNLIPLAKNIKLFGLTLSTNNRFNEHIKIKSKQLNVLKHKLNSIFKNRKIQTNIKCNVYKQYIRPVATYASPIWCRLKNCSSHQMEKLRVIERGILRNATNSYRKRNCYKYVKASIIYKRAKALRLDRYIALRHLKFYTGLHNSFNQKLNNIVVDKPFGNGSFKAIDFMLNMHNNDQLIINDQFSLFNLPYNSSNTGFVYSLSQ